MEFKDGQIIKNKHVYLKKKFYTYDESKCYLPYCKNAPGFLLNFDKNYIVVYYYQKGDLFDKSSYKELAFFLTNYKNIYKTNGNSEKMLFLVHYKRNQYYFIGDKIIYFETPEKDIIINFDGKNAKGLKYNYTITDTIGYLKNDYEYYYCPKIREVANSVKYWRKNPYKYENRCVIA